MSKNSIANGIAGHPEVHDTKSPDKIWRYAQRVHVHATGIAAFSLGLIIHVMCSDLQDRVKRAAALFFWLSTLYPLVWLTIVYAGPFHRSGTRP